MIPENFFTSQRNPYSRIPLLMAVDLSRMKNGRPYFKNSIKTSRKFISFWKFPWQPDQINIEVFHVKQIEIKKINININKLGVNHGGTKKQDIQVEKGETADPSKNRRASHHHLPAMRRGKAPTSYLWGVRGIQGQKRYRKIRVNKDRPGFY